MGHNLTYVLRGSHWVFGKGVGGGIGLKVKWEDASVEARRPDEKLYYNTLDLAPNSKGYQWR